MLTELGVTRVDVDELRGTNDRQRVNRTESTMVKTTVLKQIGMASDTMAAIVKPGFRRNPRSA